MTALGGRRARTAVVGDDTILAARPARLLPVGKVVLVVLGVLFGSLLAGCSSDPASQTTATLVVNSSTTSPPAGPSTPASATVPGQSTAAAPSDRPVEVSATFPQTDAGARDFTIAWFAALNAAYRNGDLSVARAMAGPECTACVQYLALIDLTTSDGGRLDGDAFVIDDVVVYGAETGVAELSFSYRVADVRIRRPSGAAELIPGEPVSTAVAAVEWRGTGWVMGEIGR